MVQRNDDPPSIDRDLGPETDDEDDRLGEAIEEYLALAERDQAPDLEAFLARHEDMKDDLRAALEGLELVHGLVGRSASSVLMRGGGSTRWLESGHRIAGYRVVRELGRGGMGTVYEAVHVGLDRPVALKVLGTHAAPDSSARRRFLNEAKTAAGLHHTHIVPVFDVGQVGGLCYYAMQRIEGSGLDRVIRYLRRTRPAGPVPAGSSSLGGGAAAASSSSFGSRFGQIWLRVSPGWLWRPPRPDAGVAPGTGPAAVGARDGTEAVSALAHSGLGAVSVLPPMPTGDSTASWASRRIESRDGRERGTASAPGHRGDLSGSTMALTGPTALHGPEATARGEAPPFDPPRGSSYYRWAATVGLQAADALAHAHHQGVIHRDVKPSNLLIDAKGSIWVTDFGLARRLADPGLTHHDSLLGTPRYMSPEQARTSGKVDGRTDVYSLGATLYELLTLRPPFDGQSAAELVDQIGRDDPVPPRKIDPRVPRDLETIVLKALAKRPSDRYATAAELAEDLARFLSYAPVKARRIGPVGRLWRVARRHPQIAAVTTTAAATILAIAGYSYIRILGARDEAIEALHAKAQALDKAEQANRESLAARLDQYLKTAQLLESFDGPDRRTKGLDLLQKAIALGVPPEQRAAFRDEAVKFIVLRDIQTGPALDTGSGSGLVFGPNGHRVWILSESGDKLALWDAERGRESTALTFRVAPDPVVGGAEASASGGDRGESGQGTGTSTAAAGAGRGRPRAGAPGPWRYPGRSLALAGNYIAAVLPDGAGVQLVDAMAGTLLRKLTVPGCAIAGVVADPTGQRLLTIEQLEPQAGEGRPERGAGGPMPHFQVGLWDLDTLERRTLDPWQEGANGQRPPARDPGRPDRPGSHPDVAFSPDGRTIAISPPTATWVRFFSAQDGGLKPARDGGLRDRPDRSDTRPDWIDTQTDILALALGPNALMAAVGGDQVRLYDTDHGGSDVVWSFQPRVRGFNLRFSPLGTLALAGWGGPIELWDPAARGQVAVLPGTDQSGDLAFSPDGRTLAVLGRTGTTSLWTIQDSATRIQLIGFDARPSSLAFGPDGVLAGGSDGEVWVCHSGRCPVTGQARSLAVAGGRGGRGGRGPGSPPSLAFDAEGRLVAFDSHYLRVWPAGAIPSQAPPQVQLPQTQRERVWTPPIARTPDGRVMAMLRSSMMRSSVFLWRSEQPDRLIRIAPPPLSRTSPAVAGPVRPRSPSPENRSGVFRAIQIAPAGDRLYLMDLNSRLHIWDIARSPVDGELNAREANGGPPPLEASGFALRPDGAVLAVADRAGVITLFDTARYSVLGTIPPSGDESGGSFLTLAFSPDGHTLAVGSPQGMISMYSVTSPARPRLRLRLPGHRGMVMNLAFDAQGTRLASSGTDPLVEVWDLDLIRSELLAQLGLAEQAH